MSAEKNFFRNQFLLNISILPIFCGFKFSKDEQLISVYYKVAIPFPEKLITTEIPFDFPEEKDGAQVFRWLNLKQLNPDQFTFPIDKKW